MILTLHCLLLKDYLRPCLRTLFYEYRLFLARSSKIIYPALWDLRKHT